METKEFTAVPQNGTYFAPKTAGRPPRRLGRGRLVLLYGIQAVGVAWSLGFGNFLSFAESSRR